MMLEMVGLLNEHISMDLTNDQILILSVYELQKK